jgi:hypothetical protein
MRIECVCVCVCVCVCLQAPETEPDFMTFDPLTDDVLETEDVIVSK